jgi:uncharacterized protein (UPF0212 family)
MSTVARLSDPALLAAWEAGVHRSPAGRALALAAAAVPAEQPAGLDRWPPGRRDGFLLDLHAATFGDRLVGLVACPGCGDQLEIALRTAEVRAETGDPLTDHELLVEETGHRIMFRLPGSAALADAAGLADAAEARLRLLEGCVLHAEHRGRPVSARSLPEAAIAALGAAMARLDPQAEVRLALTCPDCGHRWSALFDVAEFLWCEVDDRARTLLGEVATLAAAFGWSEREVLSLSAARRRLYLDLVGT